ncbi:hypothetical protein ACFQ4L_04225 [Lapidilactobacillus mulanensis]|uniref:Uncharacterized protein n=1 Tax=Lapidilactobacillus mulanensis TaxID=2485999 RepID=A0ABW4DMQ7_9LACO|nr:hypothetical protein [Lapidilactobacillus mulanensis]
MLRFEIHHFISLAIQSKGYLDNQLSGTPLFKSYTQQNKFRSKVLGQAVVAVTTMLAGRFCPPYMVDRFEILRSVQKLKSKLGAFPALGKAESGPTAPALPTPALSTEGRFFSRCHIYIANFFTQVSLIALSTIPC